MNEANDTPTDGTDWGLASLCPACHHCQVVVSGRGSTFYLCRRSVAEENYAKYPPQPQARCPGWEARPQVTLSVKP